jgi:hypothetical protein
MLPGHNFRDVENDGHKCDKRETENYEPNSDGSR